MASKEAGSTQEPIPPPPRLIPAVPTTTTQQETIMKNALRRTYTTALTHWPKDPLRPTCQLQDVLSKRLTESNKFPGTSQNNPAAQVNALVSLLGNRYLGKYPTSPAPESATGGLLRPRSNPTYYEDLMRDLEVAPTRGWAERVGLRLKGMFRWQ